MVEVVEAHPKIAGASVWIALGYKGPRPLGGRFHTIKACAATWARIKGVKQVPLEAARLRGAVPHECEVRQW